MGCQFRRVVMEVGIDVLVDDPFRGAIELEIFPVPEYARHFSLRGVG